MPQQEKFPRRQFLRRAATAAGLAGAGYIIPGSTMGLNGATPPSDRIVLGCIGVGGMGGGHVQGYLEHEDVQIVAISDVQESRRQRAKDWVDTKYGNKACDTYNDFRELLARKDIDAIMTATGERWHPLVCIEAARQRKHIFCEKPLAVAVEYGKAVREAVQRYGVVFQFGTQQRSSAYFRRTWELVRNGRIGQLQKIEIASAPNGVTPLPPEKPEPVPQGIDWDMWLGPSPWAPYSVMRIAGPGYPQLWMYISDYGLGNMGGVWGVHEIDIAQWLNNADDTGPISVEGTGSYYHDIRDTACAYDIHYEYANGVRVHFMDLALARKRVWQFQFGVGGQYPYGNLITGSEGWIWVSRGGMRTHPESLMRAVITPEEDQPMKNEEHKRNFISAIKTGRQPISPIGAAVRSDTVVHIGHIAVRLQRKLRWDPVKEAFENDEQANRQLWRPMRSPWRVDVPGVPRTS